MNDKDKITEKVLEPVKAPKLHKLKASEPVKQLNIKSKNNTLNIKDMQLLVIYRAIKNMKYLEQN